MPDFRGTKKILIQPNDYKIDYTFKFEPCSTATAEDGNIPFGTEISSATVTAKTEDGVVDTELIYNTTTSTDNVVVTMSYPVTNSEGTYSLTFVLTLTDDSKRERNYNRVIVRDV